MIAQNYAQEWLKSSIHPSLINLNLRQLQEEEIAEWFFQYLPRSARKNNGRIRDGYLRTYRNPLKGGWGIEGYNPFDWDEAPELRSFKPDQPRKSKDGKLIKYDFPKNAKHNPILPRISYEIASIIFRSAGLNFLDLTQTYAAQEIKEGIEDKAECRWFWRAVHENPTIPISIAEGGKKALSLLSNGRCAIALSSITTWRAERGSRKVHHWLALLAWKRKIFITFDQDDKKKTKQAVDRQAFRLSAALMRAGAISIKRLAWGGTAKGIDDYIYKLISKYGDRYAQKLLRKCYQNAQDYRKFGIKVTLPGKIKKINQRFLKVEDILSIPHKILIVKSAKGTGKTGVLAQLLEQDRDQNIPTINLSHLERLARELGERLDLPYRTEENTISLRNALGYSLCIDSFSPNNSVPFNSEQWRDAGIAIDEFTQVLRHLAFGTTELKKYRKLVMSTLGHKLADCWDYGKPIRILDADADVDSIELIYELIQLYSDQEISREELENQTLSVVNSFEPRKGELHFYQEPSPKQILLDLNRRMQRKENLLILSSSQKSRSADGTKNLERLARKFYKPEEVLRIDSKTTGDPENPAFNISGESLKALLIGKVQDLQARPSFRSKQLDLFNEQEMDQGEFALPRLAKIKVVIASPTICTGISIDRVDGYFDAVFSFQSANISPNSVRQQLVRLRDFQAPRYLWSPKLGKVFVGSKSPNPLELLTDQKGEAKLSLGLLACKEAAKLLDASICPLTKYWAKVGANQNGNNYIYREKLITDLETEGWNLIHHYPGRSEDLSSIWEQRKAIKEESIQEDNKAISNAADLDKAIADGMKKKKNLTKKQQDQLYKFQIKEKYSVEEVLPKLIEADQKKYYPALKLRFWLTLGRPHLEAHDKEQIEKHQESNNGAIFIPDLNKSLTITKVKLLELLDLSRFLEPDLEWTNKSPELIELKDFVLKDLVRFNQILKKGIAATDSPITVLQKILSAIALKMPYLRNERDGRKRLRVYGSPVSKFNLEKIEAAILQSWLSPKIESSLNGAA